MGETVKKLIGEAELFLRLAKDDELAFDKIYRHYVKRLFPFVKKIVKTPELAEELIQDIFVQVWVCRAVFATVEYPAAYLFGMANRQALKYMKKIASDARILARITEVSEQSSNDTEEQVILRESVQALEEAVAGLPQQRRLIWDLSRKQGLSHEQIADQLKISKNTVKNQMVLALKHVRDFMDRRSGVLSLSIIISLLNSKL